jgi:hypothetical protein
MMLMLLMFRALFPFRFIDEVRDAQAEKKPIKIRPSWYINQMM